MGHTILKFSEIVALPAERDAVEPERPLYEVQIVEIVMKKLSGNARLQERHRQLLEALLQEGPDRSWKGELLHLGIGIKLVIIGEHDVLHTVGEGRIPCLRLPLIISPADQHRHQE